MQFNFLIAIIVMGICGFSAAIGYRFNKLQRQLDDLKRELEEMKGKG